MIVPITRFRREMRKWMRKQEVVLISRNKKVVCVFMPANIYDIMLETLEK